MKTTKIILAAILSLQIGNLFAGNENICAPVAEVSSTINTITLVPITPVEATFEDITTEITFFGLSPLTPIVASFEDFSVEMVSAIGLSPIMPSEADFTDSVYQVSIDINQLSPVSHYEADFE
ncbi:MAG: hypothetical protein NT004_13800 [Bacteroidetes bacterium]|nr:hypothetical protein [Bacteroidota bacterium]